MPTTRRSLFGMAASFAAAGAVRPARAAEVAKIGCLAPLSGDAAADGEEMVRGLTLAVEEINAAGGVAGFTFEVVVGDTCNRRADAVASAVERLLGEDGLHVIMTGYASGSNFEIELIAEAGIPYLLAANSQQTRQIVGRDPARYWGTWSLTPACDAYGTEVVLVVQQLEDAGLVELPGRKVALISSDNPCSRTICQGLGRSFSAAGWTASLAELVPSGEINDWRAFLAKLRWDPPDVIINTDDLPANAATFVSQFVEQATPSLLFVHEAPSVPEFPKLTNERSTGVVYSLLSGPLVTPNNPRAQQLLGRFRERWGIESGTYGAALYEQAQIYFAAVAEVGDPTNREAVGTAIGLSDIRTAQGRVVFDPQTHLARQGDDFIPIQFYQLWDGQRVLFYPGSYATGMFRAPPWMG